MSIASARSFRSFARSRSERTNGAPAAPVNVASPERLASLAGGGLLAAYGLTRGSVSGLALAAIGGGLLYRGLTGHCHTYHWLGIDTAQREQRQLRPIPAQQGVKIEESTTIQRSPEELYAYWRQFENLPRFMPHLISVTDTGNNRWHWVARGPAGNVEWDAEIITDRQNELISWRSLDGSTVATAGSVRFRPAPGNRGTEMYVSLSYVPPAGKLGAAIAWLTGRDPHTEIREDLRNFKRIMETGCVPTTKGQPRGKCS
jgi:uncharacterized membrane protein